MKNVVWACGIALGVGLSPLHSGSVIFLDGTPEADGKLTLNATTIQVEDVSSQTIDLSNILEADFAEAPFHLDYFSSNHDPDQLPPDWKIEDIGKNDTPASFSYAKGAFNLVSNTHVITNWGDQSEHSLCVARPWTGDGQWTVRVREFDPQQPNAVGGVILREGFDPNSGGEFLIGVSGANGGNVYMRAHGGGYYGNSEPMLQIPVWLRLTRNGLNLAVSSSSDGRKWDILNQNITDPVTGLSSDAWVGLIISNSFKPPGRDVMDQVTFTPGPSRSDVLPCGVLLGSGTYLAGVFGQFDITSPTALGSFSRNGKPVSISAAQIATVILYPTTRRQLAENGTQSGLLMKNGDYLPGDIESISCGDGDYVVINSLALGISNIGERFGQTPVRSAFLHPVKPQPSDYEIRLKDGSIIRATSLAAAKGQLVIGEASGVSLTVDPGEIAQFRAGPAHAQNLLELPWKASPPPSSAPPANPAPAAKAAPGANPAPTANAAPAAAAPPETPPVECWEGNNQEQIMVAAAGTAIAFPLTGNFRALALKVALSPDSPPNARAMVRILADGKEIDRTPSFKAGDPPAWVQVTLQKPKTVTLAADSPYAGTRLLFIDPVAIRDK